MDDTMWAADQIWARMLSRKLTTEQQDQAASQFKPNMFRSRKAREAASTCFSSPKGPAPPTWALATGPKSLYTRFSGDFYR